MLSLLFALHAPAAADVVRHALLVGNNAPVAGLETLLWAEEDARRMSEVLVDVGGFERSQITVLSSPTAIELDQALARHRSIAAAQGEDLFFFYYSGHADHGGLRLVDQTLAFDHLRAEVRGMPSEVKIGVLDACRSGEITRLKGLAIAPAFLDEADLSARGEAWLTAASADESAQESDRLQGSFFTHYLVSGLRGAADSGNGLVSLDEAYAYAYERTVARTGGTLGGTQHPSYDFRIQGKGDLPLTDVRRASARLRLPEELAGVLTVLREPDEQPVAEVAKREGQEVVLALPAGTYRLQLRVGGDTQEGRIGLSEGSDLALPAMAFRAADQRVAQKGEAGEGGEEPALALAAAPAGSEEELAAPPEETPTGTASPHEDFRPNRLLGRAAEWSGETLMQAGARLQGGESTRERQPKAESDTKLDLRHSPAIAATASALLPGAGQAYNGQWTKGAAMFGGWALTTGGSFSIARARGDSLQGWGGMMAGGLTPGLMMAQGLRGWAAADAWQYHRKETTRPVTGVALSYGTLWHLSGESPQTAGIASAGISADWVIEPGFSLGLDRTGFLTRPDGSVLVDTGTRLTWGITERGRFRPGLFLYGGLHLDTRLDQQIPILGRTGVGAQVRTYLTPRYYLEVEGRGGQRGKETELNAGGGFGLHFGPAGAARSKEPKSEWKQVD